MISIVIPTYNHENVIAETVANLKKNAYCRLVNEIIVVDGGSTDNTAREAHKAGAIVVHSVRSTIGAQLNLGVAHTTGEILYFIAPGSFPQKNFTNEIVRAILKGYGAGVFQVEFEYKHWLLKSISYLSRIRKNFASLDEQSLFVKKELFLKIGSFREELTMLEDLDIINRIRRYSNFIILKENILATVEKFSGMNTVRKESARVITQFLYRMNYPQKKLITLYQIIAGKPKVRSHSLRGPVVAAAG